MQEEDKTIIVFPGGKQSETGTQVNTHVDTLLPPDRPSALPSAHDESPSIYSEYDYHGEPFVGALRILYGVALQAESSDKSQTIQALKRTLIHTMDHQTQRIAQLGYENTDIMIARYILSTFLDEHLGSLSWPGGESWANHSLLGHYYNETYGGEKFFHLLDQFAQEPGKYLHQMKLIYACLSLGYKGRYSMNDRGEGQLERIRQELYARIKRYDVQQERFFDNHPVSTQKHTLTLHIPYKLFIAGSLVIMAIVYGVFSSIVSHNETGLMELFSQNPVVKAEGAHDGQK